MAEAAWICGFCDHILDPSVLGEGYDGEITKERVRLQSDREERTSLIAWHPKPDLQDEVPDAMILGDVGVSEGDFQVVRGAAQSSNGRTATYLFYTSGATSRIVHPDAIPRITGGDHTIPRTPYEDFILSQIDGQKSVREIHRSSGLAPQEVVVTLLTLLDKGAIRIDGLATEKPEKPVRLRDIDEELETTQAIERPISHVAIDDSDDLPQVTDFEELIDEVNEELAQESLPRMDSMSDVWAESDPSVSAAQMNAEEAPTQLGEEVTNAARPPSKKKRNQRSDTKPPVRPVDIDPLNEMPTSEDPPDEPTISPARPASVAAPPLLLDPAFLVEVPGEDYDSEPVVEPVGETRRESTGKKRQAKEQQRKVLEKAAKRGPISERIRREDLEPKKKTPTTSEKAPPPPPPATPTPQNGASAKARAKGEPADSLNMLKAQKLFDQALKDKAEGNLVSARMNMKLAMTFDPTNELYSSSFDELSKNPDAQPRSGGPTGKSRARELYDQATEAESSGDVDRAVELLEQAIGQSKQAPFLNRLGVILAMKKKEFQRAQQLIAQAIELAPDNAAYEKNLQKILSMQATSDMRRSEEKDPKKGLLGLLGRRK